MLSAVAKASSDITAPIQVGETSTDSKQTESTSNTSQTTNQTAGTDDFSAYMKKALGGESKTNVNEEELFAELIAQRLEKENPEAAEFYKQQKGSYMVSMARHDGYVPVEDVAKAALKATVAAGKIDAATAEKVNGQAFAAAQIDSNKDALYDGRGSENDPTVAVSSMEAALTAMKLMIEKIEAGDASITSRSLDLPSNSVPSGSSSSSSESSSGASSGSSSSLSGSQNLDGQGGFLWKPEAERDGKLVILLPSELTGSIDKVEIHKSLPPSDETKVEEGRFSSVANGDRAHFRFSKPGEDYGSDVFVVAHKDNGETVSWQIGNGAERND